MAYDTGMSATELDGDFRSRAVEQRRSKERRVKYKQVNVNLIGTPLRYELPGFESTRNAVWTDRNKYKMRANPTMNHRCHCHSCRAAGVWKKKGGKGSLRYEICTGQANALLPISDMSDCHSMNEDESCIGVAYSYDRKTGPTTGADTLSYAVNQAVKKFENKELMDLLKREYEVIESSDSDEEFELI